MLFLYLRKPNPHMIKILRLPAVLAFALAVTSCGAKKAAPAPAEVPMTPATPLTAVQEEGHQLYENNCAKCHDLFAPNSYSKKDWVPILASMQKKAKLSDSDMAKIKGYLDVYAK